MDLTHDVIPNSRLSFGQVRNLARFSRPRNSRKPETAKANSVGARTGRSMDYFMPQVASDMLLPHLFFDN